MLVDTYYCYVMRYTIYYLYAHKYKPSTFTPVRIFPQPPKPSTIFKILHRYVFPSTFKATHNLQTRPRPPRLSKVMHSYYLSTPGISGSYNLAECNLQQAWLNNKTSDTLGWPLIRLVEPSHLRYAWLNHANVRKGTWNRRNIVVFYYCLPNINFRFS